MKIKTDDETMIEALNKIAMKMQKTLDDCRSAINGVAPFEITQEKVRIVKL